MPPFKYAPASVLFSLAVTLGCAQSATAQSACDLPCLQGVVESCADANSSVANWWEAGNGFQSCVTTSAPTQCSAEFQGIQTPGFSIVVEFEPLTSYENCLVLTSER